MKALDDATIANEIDEAWADAAFHGVECWCCERPSEPDWIEGMIREVYSVIDRYRPNEVTTDETDESIDELAHRVAALAIAVAHQTITTAISSELAGKVYS